MNNTLIIYCSLLAINLSLISMEPTPKERQIAKTQKKEFTLEQSMMIPVIPETSGLGVFRSAKNLLWNEEDNFLDDLEKDKYDPKNGSHPRLVNKTIEIYTTKKNNEGLTRTIKVCREKYPTLITVQHTSACMAHNFLVSEQKRMEKELNFKIISANTENKKEFNEELALLKNILEQHINNLSTKFKSQQEKQEAIIKRDCDEIKRIKKGRLQLRKLSRKSNAISKEGYCSDDDNKKPEEAITQYTNEHILQKIEVSTELNSTKQKATEILKKLAELFGQIQSITELPIKQ